MWTPTTRAQHSRAGLRYGSDLTDAEWEVLSPLLPPARQCGRHRKWPMRELIMRSSSPFGAAAPGTCCRSAFRHGPPCIAGSPGSGTWETINHHLVMLDRERAGREASPTAAVIDSQSVKTTE